MQNRLTRCALAGEKVATGALLQQEYLDQLEPVEVPGERQGTPGTKGVVAAIVEVTRSRRTALSTCLGSSPATKVKVALRSTTDDAGIGAFTSMRGSSFLTTPCSSVSGSALSGPRCPI